MVNVRMKYVCIYIYIYIKKNKNKNKQETGWRLTKATKRRHFIKTEKM